MSSWYLIKFDFDKDISLDADILIKMLLESMAVAEVSLEPQASQVTQVDEDSANLWNFKVINYHKNY